MLLIPKQILYILDAGKFYQFWQQIEELVEGMPEKHLLSFRNFFYLPSSWRCRNRYKWFVCRANSII